MVAQPVAGVFLGAKWDDMIPLIQVLSVNYVLSVSLSSAAYVYLALGTPRHSIYLVMVQAAVSLTAMLWLIPNAGIQGAAVALLLGGLVTVPLNFRLMSKAVDLTLGEISRIISRPVVATLVMVLIISVAKQYWLPGSAFQANALNRRHDGIDRSDCIFRNGHAAMAFGFPARQCGIIRAEALKARDSGGRRMGPNLTHGAMALALKLR